MTRLRAGLALAVLSSLVSLLLLEALGRIAIREPLGLFRRSETLGYEMIPYYEGRHRKLGDFDVTIRTDGSGHRIAGGAPPATGPTLLFLGDSVTFGWGVEAERSWPAQVAQRMAVRGRPIRAVNAGVWGYNTLQQIALLDALDPSIRPVTIVVGLTTPVTPTRNWHCRARGSVTLEPLLPPEGGLLAPVHAFLKGSSHVYSFAERWIRFHPNLLTFGAPATSAVVAEPPAGAAAAASVELLGELATRADRLDATIAIIVFPTRAQLGEPAAGDAAPPSAARELREEIVGRLHAAKIPVLDLTESLAARQSAQELFLPRDDVHPNADGHARSAERIDAFLQEIGS